MAERRRHGFKQLGQTLLCVSTVVVGLIALAPTTAQGASSQKPGIGSSLAAWKHAYGVSKGPGLECSAKNVCFGPAVRNSDSGRTWQFSGVHVTAGVIDGYSEDFPNGTTIAVVMAAIRRTLPADATIGPLVIDTNGGSCGLINVTSPTLAKELGTPKLGDPQGVVGIELQHISADLNSVYNPRDIQTATVEPLAEDPTASC